MRKRFPNYDIVLGGDLNSFLAPFSVDFSMYPENSEDTTTVKKRTFTQGQFNKADKVVR